MAFVTDVGCPSAEQVLNKTFDHWSAVSTGTGNVHLVWGALSSQARLIEDLEHSLLRGRRRHGFDRPWNAHGENPSGMECLTQRCVIEGQVTGQGVDDRLAALRDPYDGVLHFVDQWQHITIIPGVPHGEMKGKREGRGHLGDDPGSFGRLARTVTLAFQD